MAVDCRILLEYTSCLSQQPSQLMGGKRTGRRGTTTRMRDLAISADDHLRIFVNGSVAWNRTHLEANTNARHSPVEIA